MKHFYYDDDDDDDVFSLSIIFDLTFKSTFHINVILSATVWLHSIFDVAREQGILVPFARHLVQPLFASNVKCFPGQIKWFSEA